MYKILNKFNGVPPLIVAFTGLKRVYPGVPLAETRKIFNKFNGVPLFKKMRVSVRGTPLKSLAF
jgi:hypothetical protein